VRRLLKQRWGNRDVLKLYDFNVGDFQWNSPFRDHYRLVLTIVNPLRLPGKT
jgi:hypothetical protein